MRSHFETILQRDPSLTKTSEIEGFLYMSYWYAGLYVVVEGWRTLNLTDPVIDRLLQSENTDLLKRYRNGVFHFQSDYDDERFLAFVRDGNDSVSWVRELNTEFGGYFLQRLRSS